MENAMVFAIVFGVFAFVFFILGVSLVLINFFARKKAQESAGWPATSGEVIHSGVRRESSVDTDGDTSYSYYPDIQYRFQVGGQVYTGDKISFGMRTGYGRSSKAQEKANQYPAGTRVHVYYNPQKPTEAVLDRAAKNSTVVLVVGGVFLLMGLCAGCGALFFGIQML